MGLLDDLMGDAGAGPVGQGATLGPEHAAMATAVLGMVGQQPGGLDSLLKGFQQGGLGDMVSSWISTSPNQQATPAQVEKGLGAGMIAQLAQRAGVSPQMASTILAVVLPLIVNRLTPKGQVPQQDALTSMLGSLLGGQMGTAPAPGADGGLLGGLAGSVLGGLLGKK